MSTKNFGLILSVLFLATFFGSHKVEATALPPAILTSDMRIGDNDYNTNPQGQVTVLQNFLTATGYFNVGVTGHFGSVTRASVIRFQGDHNISPAEGFVGPITRACISLVAAGSACGTNPGITPGTGPGATPDPSDTTPPVTPVVTPVTPVIPVTPTNTASSASMVNVSSRAQTLSGDGVAVSGFTIGGNGSKRVIIRGIGPSLTAFGISHALGDPTISLRDSSGQQLAFNNNWQDTDAAAISATGVAPTNALESAIIITLNPGSYTVILSGNNITGGNNVGVVETYDLSGGAEITSVSTRGKVEGGDSVIISGMIVQSTTNTPQQFVFRGIGPSLSNFGLSGAISDPTITLYNSVGTAIDTNNDWRSGDDEASIQNLGLAPSNDRESALMKTLPPGAYTVVLRGANNVTGIGLVDIYKVASAVNPSCIDRNPNSASAIDDCKPQITSVNPTYGAVGTQVTITGNHFDSRNYLMLNGAFANTGESDSSSDGRHVTFTIPEYLSHPSCNPFTENPCLQSLTGVTPGEYKLAVANIHGTSDSESFTVGTTGCTGGGCSTVHTGTITASPNPIVTSGNNGITNISWTSNSPAVEVHLNSPTGPLFAAGGANGSALTGSWVTNGMVFYLQDASPSLSTNSAHTLATVTVTLNLPTTPPIVVTPPTHNYNPAGYFETVDSSGVAIGWAVDQDQGATSIDVHFYIDGVYAGQTNANLSRPDVNQVMNVTGNHGFRWTIPGSFRNGASHTIRAYGIDIGGNGSTNSELTQSPRTFTLTQVLSVARSAETASVMNSLNGLLFQTNGNGQNLTAEVKNAINLLLKNLGSLSFGF